MAAKRTKADKLERQTEQRGKKVDRDPDEIEKEKATGEGVNQAAAQTVREVRYSPMKPKPSPLAPKSDEMTVLIPIEQQIQQRAYEPYEQRGRSDGHDLDD